MEIKRIILDALNFDPRRRKAPERTLAPEAGATDVCTAVLEALGIREIGKEGRSLHMNGRRAGFIASTGLFYIDEPQSLENQIGIKSNGVHVEMYEIPNRDEPGVEFNPLQTKVTFEQVNHFVKVASWLGKPGFDIRKFPLNPPKA